MKNKKVDLLNGAGEWEDIYIDSEYLKPIPNKNNIDFLEELQGGEKLKVVYKNGEEVYYSDIHGTLGYPTKFN